MFHPSEVELAGTAQTVIDAVERTNPSMLVFDSLAELRLLAENTLRYRRQVLALKQYFARAGVTVFFIEDRTGDARDLDLHSIAGGVMSLEREPREYGPMRRRLQITKLRTRTFDEGLHDFVIRRGGLEIYPRIVAREHHQAYDRGIVRSGLAELDALLGGGLAKGTSTLLAGPAGAGKSSLATHYAFSAAKEGGHACMFLFDEALPTLLERSAGLGMPLEPLLEAGRLKIQQVDPVELSAGEFGQLVRSSVRPDETSIVVIDSLNGYLNAMPSDRFLTLQLHELLMYLGQQGVSTLLVLAHQGMMGPMTTPFDASYLADTVILLRYFEAFGEIRQAISVVKKRTGKHERSIRELRMNDGITVGPPLREFQGVLSGVPDYVGNAADVSAGTRTMKAAPALEGRVLVLAPTTADAELSEVILSDAGFAHEIYRDLPALCAELAGGVAALVITEESVANGEVRSLFDALNAQPDWSDLPILFLSRTGADSPAAVSRDGIARECDGARSTDPRRNPGQRATHGASSSAPAVQAARAGRGAAE